MNTFKKILSTIADSISNIFSRKNKSIRGAYNQYLSMKKAGLDTNATKLFEQLRNTFESKHGKSLLGGLNKQEYTEAGEIADAFLNMPTATDEKINETAEKLNITGNTVSKAKKVDALLNQIDAERIARVLGSPTVNAVWQSVRNSDKSVKAMKMAIDRVTDKYERLMDMHSIYGDADPSTLTKEQQDALNGYEWYTNSTQDQRADDIIDEYNAIIEELGL